VTDETKPSRWATYLSRALCIALLAALVVAYGYFSRPREPRCWEAPREAFQLQRRDDIIASGNWLRNGNEPPIYCVQWMSAEFTQVGRERLADRCWAAKPLSEEACRESPVSP